MNQKERNAIITVVIVILVGIGVALAGSQGGSRAFGVPVFALAIGWAFLVQWLVFIPSFLGKSEKFFDLTGSIIYTSAVIGSVLLSETIDARSILLMVLVIIWAGRLGTFLFLRVKKAGKDARFDELKVSFFRFLQTWTLQGLWVSLTLAAALAAITTANRKELGIFALIGTLIWVVGFAFEAVADAQKNRFRAVPENKGKFIRTGLWSRSRHPNYFGEIVLWIGVAIIALPVLQGWQWVTLISPVFVTLLLTRVSGIPLLEKRADAKWGGQEDYETYKKNTPVLIPRLW